MEETSRVADASSPASGWTNPPLADAALRLQNLVLAYAVFVDSGQAEELANLFTPDAVWDGSELGFGMATGPGEIVQNVLGHLKAGEPMMHLPGPPLLTQVSDTTAEGLSWCMATRLVDGRTTPVIYFSYEDHFRRDQEGCWRFARRHLHSAFANPSLR